MGAGFLRGGEQELFGTAIALGLFFSATLMFSQSLLRHRGLTLGATMIFLGYLIGTAVGLAPRVAPGLLALPLVGIVVFIIDAFTTLEDALLWLQV